MSPIWMVVQAEAHNCTMYAGGCVEPGGNSSTYRINVDDFTAAEESEIELAAEGWDAGSGEVNRGADWHFLRGGDVHSDGFRGDFTNTVRMKPPSFFNGQGMDTLGQASTLIGMVGMQYVILETDISFKDTVNWTTTVESVCSGSEKSLGQAALHEFGHALGRDHEDDWIATMNSAHPAGGDISATKYRINEDDFLGLKLSKPGSSTGKNFMLSKFGDFLDNGVEELWDGLGDDASLFSCGCPGQVVNPAAEIAALITGSVGTQHNVDVQWRLDPVGPCWSGTEYLIGSTSVSIGVNNPTFVRQDTFVTVPNVPAGDYYLCAKIDADDSESETSESDNLVRSEKAFTISNDCAPACGQ